MPILSIVAGVVLGTLVRAPPAPPRVADHRRAALPDPRLQRLARPRTSSASSSSSATSSSSRSTCSSSSGSRRSSRRCGHCRRRSASSSVRPSRRRIIHRFRPSVIMGTGMAIAAIGTAMLLGLSVDGDGSLLLIAGASVVISLGLAPVITLATELIVGSAPPEQAGAATGMSETSGELGGALGHRDPRQHRHGGVPIRGRERASVRASRPRSRKRRATRSAARWRSRRRFPEALGSALVAAAQVAFVDALHFVAAVADRPRVRHRDRCGRGPSWRARSNGAGAGYGRCTRARQRLTGSDGSGRRGDRYTRNGIPAARHAAQGPKGSRERNPPTLTFARADGTVCR